MATLASIRKRLSATADANIAAGALRFFKTDPGEYGHGDKFLGLRVPTLRAMVRDCDALSLEELGTLLDSEWHEERLLALLSMSHRYAKRADERDALYALYLAKTGRINNWDLVDSSAEHIVGAHLRARSRAPLTRLARSNVLWERRIAMLATFHYIKRGDFDETLRIATILLHDPHDLIHKAVGWMLREVGKRDRAVEEAFLRNHAHEMPRTMLRYAIERFPEELRRELASPRGA